MSDIVVGIDLGTSNSVISVVLEGEAIVIPDRQGHRIHPSVVHFREDGQTVVGNEARPFMAQSPRRTVYSAKRLIGRPFDSPEIKMLMGSFPFSIVEADDGTPRIKIDEQRHPPEGVGARVLSYLKGLAEEYLGQSVDKAVITVPANFDEGQRRATKRAGELAGLEVMRLVNEPTAAALAYGYGGDKRERVTIYDFGGGTFDVTLLELRDNVFEVLSTAGNSYLGGDDFDNRLVSLIVNAFERQHQVDLSADEMARQRLRVLAEDIKCQLSEQESVAHQITEYVPGTMQEVHCNFELSRREFNERCMDIVDQSLETCQEALQTAGLKRAELNHLVLVGGSTRIPIVQRRTREFFNREPVLGINPDEVVAIGAAVFGSSLAEQSAAPDPGSMQGGIDAVGDEWMEGLDDDEASGNDGPLLIDVTPHALGIATVGGVMDIIIERNGQLPLERTRYFSPSRDQQTRVLLPVYSGNSRRIEENQQLGTLQLTDIPPGPREEVQIEVTFEVDTNGMLSVRATDMRTGLNQFARLSIMGDSAVEDDYDASDLLM